MNRFFNSEKQSEGKTIRFRVRGDLSFFPIQFKNKWSYVVKDSLSLKYFRLSHPEYQILTSLNGSCSLSDIQFDLATTFPELNFKQEAIQSLIGQFHKLGLVIPIAGTRIELIDKQRASSKWQKIYSFFASPWTIRFPGIQVDWILDRTAIVAKLLFSRISVFLVLLIGTCALSLLALNWSLFCQRLPDFNSFFSANNLFLLMFCLMLTKTLHELGHAYSCKFYRCDCHQIGFMWMVATPALYCDTTDSWTLANKWQRMAISAAGIYVELAIAAIATFIWWFSNPGTLHYCALNVMFLCSTSTIIFNANPLLRYDGYYVLADWLEIPNLAQRSNKVLKSIAENIFLGIKARASSDVKTAESTLLLAYGISSFFYRWFILFGIFWFIRQLLTPMKLEVIAWCMLGVVIAASVGRTSYLTFKYFSESARRVTIKKANVITSGLILLLVLAALFFFKLPHVVHSPFVVKPADAQIVYVQSSGRVEKAFVRIGQQVKKGQILCQLRNELLELELQEMLGRKEQFLREQTSLELIIDRAETISRRINELSSAVHQLDQQIALTASLVDQLTIKADRDGVVIAPPNSRVQAFNNASLSNWNGYPTDPQNQGAFFERETIICFVGDPLQLEANLLVNQENISLVKPGHNVEFLCRQSRNRVFDGIISIISESKVERISRELSSTNQGPIPIRTNEAGFEEPIDQYFDVKATLSETTLSNLSTGFFGTAKIRVEPMTVAEKLWRKFSSTFSLK